MFFGCFLTFKFELYGHDYLAMDTKYIIVHVCVKANCEVSVLTEHFNLTEIENIVFRAVSAVKYYIFSQIFTDQGLIWMVGAFIVTIVVDT